MVGGMDLQYYQILYSPIRQPTSWRMITFQSFSHKSESSEPRVRPPQPGGPAPRRGTPRTFGFEGIWGLIARTPQD